MFSTRTTSQGLTTDGSGDTNVNTSSSTGTESPTVMDGNTGSTGPPEPPVPDCPVTYVQMQLQVVPELDLTICKPKIKVTNKAICVPNCECEGCV